jgi:hypothetical protein
LQPLYGYENFLPEASFPVIRTSENIEAVGALFFLFFSTLGFFFSRPLDYLVRYREQLGRDVEVQRFCGFKIDIVGCTKAIWPCPLSMAKRLLLPLKADFCTHDGSVS